MIVKELILYSYLYLDISEEFLEKISWVPAFGYFMACLACVGILNNISLNEKNNHTRIKRTPTAGHRIRRGAPLFGVTCIRR